ncbi:MAG: DUF2169 domain-containing protein [Polyangiales bacterium]
MQVFKQTPFEFGFLPWQVRPPTVSLVVVVKATLDLHPEGYCAVAAEQQPTQGPTHHDDDPGASLVRDTDFAIFKPRAECFAVGSAHPPGGAAPSCRVSFGVGAVERSLLVFGDRTWDALGGMSEPAPFVSMPLRWERAFGGPDHPVNPVGRGIAAVETRQGRTRPLPNLEDPADLLRGPGDRPPPTCFAPLHPAWPARLRRTGTYDPAWLKTRWPWLPDDFDWAYYNAAPAPQQVEGYWRGDERVWAKGMHPVHASIEAQLPGHQPRCFLEIRRPEGVAFTDVALRCDTITLDMEHLAAVVVWRGLVEVPSESLDEVETLFLLHESIHDAPRPLAHYQALLAREKAARAAEDQAFEPEAPDDDDLAPAPAPAPAPPFAEVYRELAARRLEAAAGADDASAVAVALVDDTVAALQAEEHAPEAPAPRPSEVRASMRAEGVDVPAEIEALEDPPAPPPEVPDAPEALALTREQVLHRRAHEQPLAGEDLTGCDLSGCDLSGQDLSGCVLTDAKLAGCVLRGTVFDGAVLQRADLRGSSLEAASFRGADLVDATGDDVVADGACFDDAVAHDSTWRRARAQGARLVGADLARACFDDANLRGAALDQAELDGASLARCVLDGATLVETSMEGARAPAASLNACDLTGLRASEAADFSDAQLRDVVAPGAQFVGSNLARASLARARLEGADLSRALLAQADLTGANLRGARMLGTCATQAVLLRADLFEANLEGAELTLADLRGASLFSAQLFRARLDGARLEHADVGRTALDPAVR